MSLRKLLPVLLLATTAPVLADDAGAPPISGIDPSAMDATVRPQDDLFRHVNGTWLKTTDFPAEYASAGIGIMLFEKAQAEVQAILLEPGPATTPDKRRSATCTRASWTRRASRRAASSP